MLVVRSFLFLALFSHQIVSLPLDITESYSKSNPDDEYLVDYEFDDFDSEFDPLVNQYKTRSKNDQNKTLKMNEEEADYYYEDDPELSSLEDSMDSYEWDSSYNVSRSQMDEIYGHYQVCRINSSGINECLNIGELNQLMAEIGNEGDHLWAWQAWHNGVGRQLRPLFLRFVEMNNKEAKQEGFADYGDQLRNQTDIPQLESVVQYLYSQVEPLYKQLHAYVRRHLYNTYGADKIDLRGPLPAHLLGDMWGRYWVNLNSLVQPYPDKHIDNLERRMFRTGNVFFTSARLSAEKISDDGEIVCDPTSWNFDGGKEHRIQLCARLGVEDGSSDYSPQATVQYVMKSSDPSTDFGNDTFPSFYTFDESERFLFKTSFSNIKHPLYSLGLLNEHDDHEMDMNFLMFQALNTISSLPFHLIQGTWQWKVFRGDIPLDELNDQYWVDKVRVVGVSPPVHRDSDLDLDITAMFHVCFNDDTIESFIMEFFQYQFNEAICQAAGHTGPVYKCDYYNSTAAGDKLLAFIRLNESIPWQDAMEVLTGHRDFVATPLLNYFEPLRVWLEAKNAENNEYIGWDLPITVGEL